MSLRVPAAAVLALLSLSCGTGVPRFTPRPAPEPVRYEAGELPLSGVASYYADEFHGRTTANGEVYDMHALTAAHPALPFNTKLRVTNLMNGSSVVVRVNDRGPFKAGRIIDLSLEAAKRIGLIAPGTAPVSLEILAPESAGER
jgi:rare lipoprotein A